jgi:hypothetical protein
MASLRSGAHTAAALHAMFPGLDEFLLLQEQPGL